MPVLQNEKREPPITGSMLEGLLTYDPDTGIFTAVKTRGRHRAGKRAGSKGGEGYIIIKINRRNYRAHQLAWVWMFGEWPRMDIGHINRDRSDNRIANLRLAITSPSSC